MDELSSSNALLGDPGALRRRLAEDGYLFFRGGAAPGWIDGCGLASADRRALNPFRWQYPDQPVPAQLVLGPGGRQWEMFSRMFARESWWEPVPAGLALTPRERLANPPGPSRYFPVHPGWRYWRPPVGAVH